MPRKKLNKAIMPGYKIDPETPAKLAKIAREVGYPYGETGQVGAFLDALSNINPDLLKLVLNHKNN